jgi:hypothetical protein
MVHAMYRLADFVASQPVRTPLDARLNVGRGCGSHRRARSQPQGARPSACGGDRLWTCQVPTTAQFDAAGKAAAAYAAAAAETGEANASLPVYDLAGMLPRCLPLCSSIPVCVVCEIPEHMSRLGRG